MKNYVEEINEAHRRDVLKGIGSIPFGSLNIIKNAPELAKSEWIQVCLNHGALSHHGDTLHYWGARNPDSPKYVEDEEKIDKSDPDALPLSLKSLINSIRSTSVSKYDKKLYSTEIPGVLVDTDKTDTEKLILKVHRDSPFLVEYDTWLTKLTNTIKKLKNQPGKSWSDIFGNLNGDEFNEANSVFEEMRDNTIKLYKKYLGSPNFIFKKLRETFEGFAGTRRGDKLDLDEFANTCTKRAERAYKLCIHELMRGVEEYPLANDGFGHPMIFGALECIERLANAGTDATNIYYDYEDDENMPIDWVAKNLGTSYGINIHSNMSPEEFIKDLIDSAFMPPDEHHTNLHVIMTDHDEYTITPEAIEKAAEKFNSLYNSVISKVIRISINSAIDAIDKFRDVAKQALEIAEKVHNHILMNDPNIYDVYGNGEYDHIHQSQDSKYYDYDDEDDDVDRGYDYWSEPSGRMKPRHTTFESTYNSIMSKIISG